MNTKWNATVAILTLSLLCVACSGDESTSDAPLDFVAAADAGLIEIDMGPALPSPPSNCRENENLARLLPILTGGKNHPTGRGEHATVYEHCNQRLVLFGGNDFQPEECQDFGP